MFTKLCQRLSLFYVNFTLALPGKSELRVNQFLSKRFCRQDELIKLRREQYRDILQSFGMTSADFKWFTKVGGDSLMGTSKIFF